jgi:hypothetical protein
MSRLHQVILIGSNLLGSWLGMQAVHELGHILAAWATGGQVTQVVLSPASISRTDVANNHHPLIVAWAGPIVGITFPLTLWAFALLAHWSGEFLVRFFAGFCLLANGVYIAFGAFGGVGDCGEMLRHGSARWQLWLFGAITMPMGLWLWHGQAASFGLGAHRREVSHRSVYVSLSVCLALLILGCAVGGE